MNSNSLLIDTDVLIDYLRGYEQSVHFLENLNLPQFISSITVAELFSGVRDGKEMETLQTFLKAFDIIPVTPEIATAGGLIRRDFGKSHGTGIADAIIAASANSQSVPVVTLNDKHFPMLEDLIVPYSKA